MKKNLVIGLIIFAAMSITADTANARTVTRVYNVPNQNYNNYSNINPYTNDLSRIEDYLYGRTYRGETPENRLNRIEKTLFNKTYPSLHIAQRMNNALENYRDDYYNRNYLSQYYSNSTPATRIRNRFLGQPTGFTPQITNTPFGFSSMPGINSNYSHNRSYGYNNFVPANMGAGIHILN